MSGLNRLLQSRHSKLAYAAALLAISLTLACTLPAQPPTSSSSSSSSGSSSSTPDSQAIDATPSPRIAQQSAGGSAITLETSEPLFYIAAALNACGYDADLATSSPVRQRIIDEMNEQLTTNAPARDARDALCTYLRQHSLSDPGHDLAQYVSLALYLSPPPALELSVSELDLPPEVGPVIQFLPVLRAFADAIHLNALWFEHHADYDGFVDRIHDPLNKMVLNTQLYLRMPMGSYDGRRFMVLIEPMLAPSQTNARISDNEFIVVVSPAKTPPASVPMDLIRHTFLHYEIEPLINAHNTALQRLVPLLKPVQQAPLDYNYKSDIVPLVTECLIKAVEAHLEDTGVPIPAKPVSIRDRSDADRYAAEMVVYDRQAEAFRRQTIAHEMRQGWVLVEYFYDQLASMQKEGTSLKDNIGPMVYGMDVDRERHRDEQIAFLPEGSGGDIVRRTPRKLAGLDLAEMKLMKGDAAGADEMAESALTADPANAQAHYLLGRIDLMSNDPDGALDHLTQTVQLSHDPRTIAWAHIYLGRMYDIAQPPQRDKAIAEYRAALANRDSQPDTRAAAEKGVIEAFALPKRAASTQQQDTPDDLDPSGKAAKEAYRPTSPQ